MIPSCLTLDNAQQAKLAIFLALADKQEGSKLTDDDYDVCMSSPVDFVIFATGLGDCITVKYRGYECSLSYGDEPELEPLPKILEKKR